MCMTMLGKVYYLVILNKPVIARTHKNFPLRPGLRQFINFMKIYINKTC